MGNPVSVNIPPECDRVTLLLRPAVYLIHVRPDHSYTWVEMQPHAVFDRRVPDNVLTREAPAEIWQRTLYPAVLALQVHEDAYRRDHS